LGEAIGDYDILEAATRVDAAEVVAPDVVRDSVSTIFRTRQFFDRVQSWRPSMRVMVVPQGKDTEGFLGCLDQMQMELHPFYRYPKLGHSLITVGIPKHLGTYPDVRVYITDQIRRFHKCFYLVHFLGLGGSPFEELESLAYCSTFLGIRSIDTGIPFALGQRGLFLEESTHRDPMELVTNFNARSDSPEISRNVDTLLRWTSRWAMHRKVGVIEDGSKTP